MTMQAIGSRATPPLFAEMSSSPTLPPLEQSGRQLVSVIVPAFNASGTLAATLDSALGQTHDNLEVIVVNDGSTDGTQAVAERYARQDSRIRTISTRNRGVAATRNTGIAEACGELIAPLDADDLWHPQKITRQLETLFRGGPQMGFVYAGYRRVDVEGRVIASSPLKHCEGHVFLRSLFTNLVGNGSGMLARRQALEENGGYSEELRRQGLEGTEDRLLQIQIARRWTVGLVPAYLIGYRKLSDAMSADRVRMSHSQLATLSMVARRYPDVPKWVLDAAIALAETDLAFAQLNARSDPLSISASLFRAVRHSPETTARHTFARLQSAVLRRTRGSAEGSGNSEKVSRNPDAGIGLDFFALSPEDGISSDKRHRLGWLLDKMAHEEAAFAAPAERRMPQNQAPLVASSSDHLSPI